MMTSRYYDASRETRPVGVANDHRYRAPPGSAAERRARPSEGISAPPIGLMSAHFLE